MCHKIFFGIVHILFFFMLTINTYAEEVTRGSYVYTSSVTKVLGSQDASAFSELIDINEEISWEIHVPENYNTNAPPGILIYISPQNKINIPRGWLDTIEKNNLIWIAAVKSGNKIIVSERIMKALLAPVILQSTYKIDTNRIYITGFSGGGRVASMVATRYPHLIKGAIYNCGVNFWDNLDEETTKQVLSNRFVFITGTNDFNLNDTKSVYGKYKDAGAQNIDLMVIGRMRHENPSKAKLDQAIKFLDDK